jgi:hypothetical protein
MQVTLGLCTRIPSHIARVGGAGSRVANESKLAGLSGWLFGLLFLAVIGPVVAFAQGVATPAPTGTQDRLNLPPRVAQAQRFLARRGIASGGGAAIRPRVRPNALAARAQSTSSVAATWQPLGPIGVISPSYGLVTGRISALALDPADATGNRLYAGTTGGGVWVSQNAGTSNPANVVFTPLTDRPGALSGAVDASISIGAITVQPGGTGVILAGTGDPNDALDSYYGAGILRSIDGGNTWSLIQTTTDQSFSFNGEGFAGFAWSTVNPQLVVAAVSRAWEGVLVSADWPGLSYEGLYYSTDSGATWSLARITDQNGQDVQGPLDAFAGPDGNAATSVVWNPLRGVFLAGVRFHGYYQSTDGAHWTRLTTQPGAGLTTALCPTRLGKTGSPACPIYRGTLAVNPFTGDTFAWTVDLNNQDQGIWQDACGASGGMCTNQNIAFARQWNTHALETDTWQGSATIQNGNYNLALAAVPSSQDTILLAGGNDLWKCSLAMGCAWRNTTNSITCASAGVAEYQHALDWNPANPLEVFVGNDSGLWRSTDAIAESGSVCSAADASHFQNLNAGLGSLAEVESMSEVGVSPYTMMLGLGANGFAGVKSTTGPTANWPQILDGEGGPVAIDPTNPANWYVNNGAGVSIHLCSQQNPCTDADFGSAPLVTNANVSNDGLTMTSPAPFLVDPVDSSQLLIGTCRLWRGPANGTGWTSANAVGAMFDGNRGSSYCSGNALVRSMAAMALPGGGEIVYAGMYGSANGGATLPGRVLSVKMNASGAWSAWQDLTLNPVSNDPLAMNYFGLDVSSLFIDPHDPTGNTVYATVAGLPNPKQNICVVYGSIDGGAHWFNLRSNLVSSPANRLVIDPLDANTAYLATDSGVYFTRNVANCAQAPSACWSMFGSGLPASPVTALSAAPAGVSPSVLVAGTFGRGVWQIPLVTAGMQLTTASVSPGSLDFGTQRFGITSGAITATVTNTGGIALMPTAIAVTGDFSETDNCANATVNAGSSCTIQVTFRPSQAGTRTGKLTVGGNVAGGALTVALSGIGGPPGIVTLLPTAIDFGQVQVRSTSKPLTITAENSGGAVVGVTSVTVSGPFALVSNSCGATSMAANSDCQLTVEFQPTASGAAAGALTLVDDAGTQSVQLKGVGASPPTDSLSPRSLSFPQTIVGQTSAPQTVTLSNTGDLPLTAIAATVSGSFQLSSSCTTQLAARSSCSLSVVFTPTQTGTASGTLTVSDVTNAGQTVSLTGTGLQAPAFSVSPASLGFSAQQVGVASSPATVTIANSGGAAMANVGFAIAGPSAASFSTGTSTCGATLAAGANCTVQVIFTPKASGGSTASLTVSSSTLGVKAVSVPLTGTGQSTAGLNVSPTQLAFAAQDVGQTSAPQIVMISNSGGTVASGLAVTVSGPFSLAENNCGSSLASGVSCTTGVVFTPTSRGDLGGLLTVSSSSIGAPATVALSGIGGLTSTVQMLPGLVTFPTTGVGTTSSPVTVTVTNSSDAAALADLKLSVSAGFRIGNSTCGVSLAAGASCAVGVSFAPTATGAQTGILSLTSSALAAAATVSLSGMGFDFQAAASGASSATVASGQTAAFTLTLTPSSGSGATFALQCGALPSHAACAFNPVSETVAAGATGTVMVQVITSQGASAQLRPPAFAGWPAWPALALIILPAVWRRRRKALFLVLPFVFLGSVLRDARRRVEAREGRRPRHPRHPPRRLVPIRFRLR